MTIKNTKTNITKINEEFNKHEAQNNRKVDKLYTLINRAEKIRKEIMQEIEEDWFFFKLHSPLAI